MDRRPFEPMLLHNPPKGRKTFLGNAVASKRRVEVTSVSRLMPGLQPSLRNCKHLVAIVSTFQWRAIVADG
jgi:SpoVK/Ycf46/Vps4 family AAA+-type ATPase